jgi:hypothetical protein
MALELIAALIAAATLGLMAWALRRLVPGLPKWLVPVAAGLGLIGFTIWSEYNWFSRVSAELPAGFAVAGAEATTSPLRPWTFLFPLITRFQAIDTGQIAQHPARADLVMAPVFAFVRWQNPQSALVVFDCAGNRRVPVVEGMQIDASGQLSGADWVVLDGKDELQQAACREG